MLILGIETSCDETAVAVVKDGRDILSNIIATQYEVHSQYGGIVPELASRRHMENLPVVVAEALKTAGLTVAEIDLFAVTRGPGLLGALLVGLSAAKGMAWALRKPLVPVHHIHGHILAAGFTQELAWPFLCLVASGGHTSLYRVESPARISEISSTRDDAAGEAFDKVAKMLGLGFPGGPAVEKEAEKGNPASFDFPVPQVRGDKLAFSFSGLKTAVRNAINDSTAKADVAASFQRAAVTAMVSKTIAAAEQLYLPFIVLAGGVACNGELRKRMKEAADKKGMRVVWPEPVLCTDNGAMIAAAGYYLFRDNPDNPAFAEFKMLDAEANLPL